MSSKKILMLVGEFSEAVLLPQASLRGRNLLCVSRHQSGGVTPTNSLARSSM